MHLRVAIVLAALSGVALAQTIPGAPPVSPELPGRVAAEESVERVRPARPELTRELERTAPHQLTSEARVVAVDARRGTVSLHDEAGLHQLHVTEGTRVVERGRSTPGLTALVPGDEVRATWRPDGSVSEIVVRGRPRPEAPAVPSTPGATPQVPRTNATAPNPSAPEPGQDRPPGSVPGNYIPH